MDCFELGFDFIDLDENSTKQKGKRNSRTLSNAQTNRFNDQQKNKFSASKFPQDNRSKGQTGSNNKVRVDEDGTTLGVYMTMDELSELVKAVKENSKSKE